MYAAETFREWVREKLDAILRISKNLAQKFKRFVPVSERWFIESPTRRRRQLFQSKKRNCGAGAFELGLDSICISYGDVFHYGCRCGLDEIFGFLESQAHE